MSAAVVEKPITVQQIILAQHADLMKDVVGFLALSLFITAVLIWAH